MGNWKLPTLQEFVTTGLIAVVFIAALKAVPFTRKLVA